MTTVKYMQIDFLEEKLTSLFYLATILLNQIARMLATTCACQDYARYTKQFSYVH